MQLHRKSKKRWICLVTMLSPKKWEWVRTLKTTSYFRNTQEERKTFKKLIAITLQDKLLWLIFSLFTSDFV